MTMMMSETTMTGAPATIPSPVTKRGSMTRATQRMVAANFGSICRVSKDGTCWQVDLNKVFEEVGYFKHYNKPEFDRNSLTMSGCAGPIEIGRLDIYKRMVTSWPDANLCLTPKAIKKLTRDHVHDGDGTFMVTSQGGVTIHLCDGVRPDKNGVVRGQFDVCMRSVVPTRADAKEEDFLSVTVWPNKYDKTKPALQDIRVWGGGAMMQPSQFTWSGRIGPDHNLGNVFVAVADIGRPDNETETGDDPDIDIEKLLNDEE